MRASFPLAVSVAVLAFLVAPANGSAQEGGAARQRRLVDINTTMGHIVVALYNETPIHRDNFLKLVEQGFYDSTLFHRVEADFMVQGGDPVSKNADDRHKVLGRGGPTTTLPAEIRDRFVHTKGALCAVPAPLAENPEHLTHASQFYFVLGQSWTPSELTLLQQKKAAADPDHQVSYTPEQLRAYSTYGGDPRLDGEYTVFGEVVEGMDVLEAIGKLPVDGNGRPLTDVRIWMKLRP